MREYNNEDILVTLPDGQNTCQIGVLSIWCRQAQVLFATISVPRTTFVNNGADPCQSIVSIYQSAMKLNACLELVMGNCMLS